SGGGRPPDRPLPRGPARPVPAARPRSRSPSAGGPDAWAVPGPARSGGWRTALPLPAAAGRAVALRYPRCPAVSAEVSAALPGGVLRAVPVRRSRSGRSSRLRPGAPGGGAAPPGGEPGVVVLEPGGQFAAERGRQRRPGAGVVPAEPDPAVVREAEEVLQGGQVPLGVGQEGVGVDHVQPVAAEVLLQPEQLVDVA